MKARNLIVVFAFSVFAAVVLSACGSDSSGGTSGGTISGAGATFPQPVYDQWASDVKSSDGITVNYNPVGSGGGVAQFTAGTVDFGATDAAMKDEEVTAAEKKGTPVHVPTVFGAVTVAYNLSGVKSGLKLDGGTVADIFQGKITTWNDKAITALNPDVNLPDTKITVVHRSDESGTTKLFTTYLAAYSSSWEQEVGVDKTVKWPTGTGAAKNAGVAGAVKQTEGAIGYVELAYALQNNFTTAALKNKSGDFVEPTLESTAAAGDGLKVPDDLRFNAIDSPNAGAYPIASATFILVYEDMCKAGIKEQAAKDTVTFLNYGLGDGQDVAKTLNYAPLPENIKTAAQAKVDALTCNGTPLK
ncbi:MAG: phosphate ABC transporter substrate-binding protein PstS [Solirubrobacterales bacterium]